MKILSTEAKTFAFGAIATPRFLCGCKSKFSATLGILYLFALLANSLCASAEANQCEMVFNEIYKNGVWGRGALGEPLSGPGSTLSEGQPYIDYLNDFLANQPIQTIVDLGCGDWVLAKEIRWEHRNYIGIDVVQDLITRNSSLYSSSNIHFKHLNGAIDSLPEADLLICKDVLIHLSFSEIFSILKETKKFKYVIFVDDVNKNTQTSNYDIPTGSYRPLDLTTPPFNLVPIQSTVYPSGKTTKQILLFHN